MAELFFYALHGRVMASDCALPFLSACVRDQADIELRLTPRALDMPAARRWYRSDSQEADACPSTVIDRMQNGDLVVRFADGTAFEVRGDGGAIVLLSAPPAYTSGDVAAYALGPVLAIALHLQGAVLLHAAAVRMTGRSILFAGESGSGKSTTAAMLHCCGKTVLSDDLTEVTGMDSFAAVPSLPAMRLWPEVVEALYGREAAFPDRAPSWGKKVVAVEEVNERCDIAAVLFLEPARSAPGPRLEWLMPRAGWLRLISHAYTVRLPDPAMAQRIFDVTSAMADRIPMLLFVPPALETGRLTLGDFLERELEGVLR